VAPATLLLVFCAWLAALPESDPVARLMAWIERARLAPASVDAARQQDLRAILGELRLLRAGPRAEEHAIDAALVELAAIEWRDSATSDGFLRSARLARVELEQELRRDGARCGAWLASSVLAVEARRPRAERRLALELLLGSRVEAALPALRAAARESDAELAQAAARVLAGWPDARVHELFLQTLERGSGPLRLAAEHFESLHGELPPAVLDRLESEVARLYLAEDWRSAARARQLSRALTTERAAPILIEGLALWERRTREGAGSKRIRHELLSELQRRSGRALAADPARWSEWWQGVREGRVLLPEQLAAQGAQPTSATFFGLHAESDRVLFVVDRSGSMQQAFSTGGRTRHEEAIEQLTTFLRQSGEDTSFTLALFGDEGVAWRSRLAPATEANLDVARRWLAGKAPEGETLLYEGLRAGLGLDARGRLNLERCEVDTVIVLCDGATTEGPGWVAGWLAQENERAQIVFHCVQIGSEGNGTLEALARGSGGEFVRVQG
jgi:hypothetical protein